MKANRNKNHHQPSPVQAPRFAEWLLTRILEAEDRCHRTGDLAEVYSARRIHSGALSAWLWYWRQVLNCIPRMVWLMMSWSLVMLGNHFKIFFRTIKKQRIYSVINIMGLTLGMAGALLIFLWVRNELSMNRFNHNYDRIFRLELDNDAVLSPGIGKFLDGKIPEVEECVRLMLRGRQLMSHDQKSLLVQNLMWADDGIFNVFDFPLIKGDVRTALARPFSIILTEKTSRALFGDLDPMGRAVNLELDNRYIVTGVIKPPANFHIPFEALVSFRTQETVNPKRFVEMMHDGYEHPTYILLAPGSRADSAAEKIKGIFVQNKIFQSPDFHLRPLSDVYFTPNALAGATSGSRLMVIMFSVIAGFLLLIAGANFINLSTARASRRAKEIGIKKVIGFRKKHLVYQFLAESIFSALISAFFAAVLVCALLPVFNRLAGTELVLSNLAGPFHLAGLAASAFLLGISAGLYPAFYLASFRPAAMLKGTGTSDQASGLLRRGLVIFQFAISLILIIGTLTVSRQLHFMRHSKLGFDRNQIVVLHPNWRLAPKKEAFKQALLMNSDISRSSFSTRVPGENWWRWGLDLPGVQDYIQVNSIDPDFLDLMGIQLRAGRNFSWEQPSDRMIRQTPNGRKFILNETAAKIFGIGSGLGKIGGDSRFSRDEVIGVVEDFHFNSLHNPIEPLLLYWDPRVQSELSLKVSGQDLTASISHIEKTWREFLPQYPFMMSFLDETFDRQYRRDERMMKIFRYFSFMAVFIASLGLVGMASYVTGRRKKEIGIRKVCGASTAGIVGLILRDFGGWIVAANLIAWPVAYYVMRKWLEGFAYRTGMSIGTFLISAGIALVFTFFSVGFQAVKAALSDPVKSLNRE